MVVGLILLALFLVAIYAIKGYLKRLLAKNCRV